MSSFASDEEQLEALKRWWKENGSSLLSGIAIVLVVWFGFGQFRDSRENASVGASLLYEQIAGLAASSITTGVSEDDLLAAQSLYSQLKADHDSSVYTRYAALMMARFHVEQQQLPQARRQTFESPSGTTPKISRWRSTCRCCRPWSSG